MLQGRSKYAILELPASVPTEKPDLSRPDTKLGIGELRHEASQPGTAGLLSAQRAACFVWPL
jgi:hypothetical protein